MVVVFGSRMAEKFRLVLESEHFGDRLRRSRRNFAAAHHHKLLLHLVRVVRVGHVCCTTCLFLSRKEHQVLQAFVSVVQVACRRLCSCSASVLLPSGGQNRVFKLYHNFFFQI